MIDTDYTVRPAEFGDTRAIFELIKASPETLIPRSASDIVQNIDRFAVAVLGNEVTGTVSWQILPDIGLGKQPSVEIKSLVVAEPHRGKGVGRKLMETILERVRRLSPTQVIVLTFDPGFFAEFGFHEVPKQDLMHKIYSGCVNCTRYDSPFTCPEVAMSLELSEREESTDYADYGD